MQYAHIQPYLPTDLPGLPGCGRRRLGIVVLSAASRDHTTRRSTTAGST